jgi:SAM-dependent methyltransferase
MLAEARRLAAEAGVSNVRYVEADAQTHRFDPASTDLVFSRFGVMFFADPTAAFRNLRTALRPGAHLAFACWQPVTENPWVLVPLGAAAQHISLAPPPPPGTPGPFALSDRERVRGILEAAGFSQIACDPIGPAIEIGEHLDAATEFVVQVGPTGSALREAGPDAVPAVMGAIRRALEPFLTPRGVIMPSAAWVVSGRA